MGISYTRATGESFSTAARKYANSLLGPLKDLEIHLLLEPGRCITGPSGALLTRVLYRKRNNGKGFLVVDAAMNDLIRPSLYGAHHEIVPATLSQAHRKLKILDVVGPVCETGDFFAHDRKLPRVEEGELLVILDAGAYGMSLASNYNSRPRAAEVVVNGRRTKLVRKRESISDLWAAEVP